MSPNIRRICAVLVLVLATPVMATERKFNPRMNNPNTDIPLYLNGVGVRKYLFAEIYTAALYLTEKKKDEKTVLESIAPKVIHMRYHRAISKADMIRAWRASLESARTADGGPFTAAIREFEKSIIATTPDLEIKYVFSAEGVTVLNPKSTHAIKAPGFSRFLLSTWIGADPPTEELKLGLLGIQ